MASWEEDPQLPATAYQVLSERVLAPVLAHWLPALLLHEAYSTLM